MTGLRRSKGASELTQGRTCLRATQMESIIIVLDGHIEKQYCVVIYPSEKYEIC